MFQSSRTKWPGCVSWQGPRRLYLRPGWTASLAQPAAAGRPVGLHFEPGLQGQAEEGSVWRVGPLKPAVHHLSRDASPLLLPNACCLVCPCAGSSPGWTKAALWVQIAMLETSRVWTSTPWSAGRSSCTSWWARPVPSSVRTWRSCSSRQAS